MTTDKNAKVELLELRYGGQQKPRNVHWNDHIELCSVIDLFEAFCQMLYLRAL